MTPRQKLTLRQRVRVMRSQRLPYSEIGRRLGISRQAAWWLDKHNTSGIRGAKSKLSEEQALLIKRLRGQNIGRDEIMRRLRLTPWLVDRVLHDQKQKER